MSYIDDEKTALLVLAFPQLTALDREWIESIRKQSDTLFHGIVDPHFTLVFPTLGINTDDFINDIHAKVKTINRFNFTIRCAVMNNDSLSDYYHVFLCPDEGNSHIVKIHDYLYSGLLHKTQLLDVDFCSHITIGSSKDPVVCKNLVDAINAMDIQISGVIDTLDIIAYGDRKVRVIEKIPLR